MIRRNLKWIFAIGFVGIALALLFYNLKSVYVIYAGDRNLGITRNGPSILPEYEKLQISEADKHPQLTHATALLDPLATAYAIVVNGEKVAVVANEAEARNAISLLKAPFETEERSTAMLVEDVSFRPMEIEPEAVVTAEQAAAFMSQVKEKEMIYQVEDGDT